VKKALELISGIVLALIFLITLSQIVFRSVLKISAAWSEELATYSFAFVVFAGAAALSKDEAHINISVLMDRVNETGKRILRIVGRLISLPFMVLFTWGAWVNTQSTWTAGLPTAEWFKIGYMYLAMAFCGAIIVWYLLWNTVLDALGRFKPAQGGGIA
jgi:TRAP-type transport system small permease protein